MKLWRSATSPRSSTLPLHAPGKLLSQGQGNRMPKSASAWDAILPVSSSSPDSVRRTFAFVVLASFFLILLWLGIFDDRGRRVDVARSWGEWVGGKSVSLGDVPQATDGLVGQLNLDPTSSSFAVISTDEAFMLSKQSKGKDHDYAHYIHYRQIKEEDLGLEGEGKGPRARRLIVVGDLHGSVKEFNALLSHIAFDSQHDTLLLAGDLVAKGGVGPSLKTLSRVREVGAKGVRGNHDQKVIEWRGWMEAAKKRVSQKGSKKDRVRFEKVLGWGDERREAEEEDVRANSKKGKDEAEQLSGLKVPDGWKWGQEHFQIAKRLSREDYDYLLSLPLVLHLPSLHSYIVHAGMVAPRDVDSLQSPVSSLASLSELGSLFSPSSAPSNASDASQLSAKLPSDPELALLVRPRANADPYALLNMRSLLKDGSVTKDGHKGTPWSDEWNKAMRSCADKHSRGLDTVADGEAEERKNTCRPLTVLYGHAAARGLDVKPYSLGLDTGCVYGRELTALIIEGGKGSVKDAAGSDAVAWVDDDATDYGAKTTGPSSEASAEAEVAKTHFRRRKVDVAGMRANLVSAQCRGA